MACGHFYVIYPMFNSVKVIDKEHLNQSGAKVTTYYYQLFKISLESWVGHGLYKQPPVICLTPEGKNVKIYKQSLLC